MKVNQDSVDHLALLEHVEPQVSQVCRDLKDTGVLAAGLVQKENRVNQEKRALQDQVAQPGLLDQWDLEECRENEDVMVALDLAV